MEAPGNKSPDKESETSLTLSLTPPLSETANNDDSSISEHLSSIENDRSVQELEVSSNLPESFNLILDRAHDDNNTSISLNGLEMFINSNLEGTNNATSILEEILNNERFKSDTESAEASLDIFANIDLDDKLLNSYNLGRSSVDFNLTSLKSDSFENYGDICKKVKDFEEIIAVKDSTIAALTLELDSFRELISNSSSNSTEYKQYQEECHSKLVEYHDAISHKDEQIEKLTVSLQQSILQREELKQHFKSEIDLLQEQLSETSRMLQEHKCQIDDFSVVDFLKNLFGDVKSEEEFKVALEKFVQGQVEEKRRGYENEINNLKIKMDADRVEFEAELSRLRSQDRAEELRQELEAQHSKEVEELRTYFEKKCADLEKNYSEEVFSQQSRKISGSTSGSDTELSSDFVFNNQPGPGGDVKVEYTKKDVLKLRESLTQILRIIERFNLNELTNEEFDNLKGEIGRFELKQLLKYDLTLIRSELQNKYHAELEILREDFDNRVDVLRVEHENEMKSVEAKYLEEIEDLNGQLRGRISTVTQQEVANSGEFEIDEVVQSYERRLQEQVTLAKIDIIGALENQIQRLASSEVIDGEWPDELLQLKKRFSEKYRNEIADLNSAHDEEITRLKEEHVKTLNGALERARRRSLKDADSLSKGELELLRERDALKKQTLSLRNLVGELLKYFTQCEDELNNTLVEELIHKNQQQVMDDVDLEESSNESDVKRVHLTPNFSDLINLIDSTSENDLDSLDLKGELGLCLEKLKSDANAILALTSNLNNKSSDEKTPNRSSVSVEQELTSLTRKLINERQIKSDLTEQLSDARCIIQSLESDRETVEKELEQLLDRQKILEGDLAKAREKISELIENGHREIVSEGYGEKGHEIGGLDELVSNLRELQEKTRVFVENPSGSLDQTLLHLLEDLSRVGEKIVEEARKDSEDLKRQIEAADKKYKITCQFLEDQAAEREQERDEAQKEIDRLGQMLKDREKDRASCEQIMNEVENLEQQVRELTKTIEVSEKRCKEAENERREAVEKIFELRDIIRDLEEQVKIKSQTEGELRNIIEELESFVKNHTRSDDESNQGLENTRSVSSIRELHNYIGDLEGEVQKLRLSTEIAGSEGALQQIKNHLCDFEVTLDKRTKDLEGLHSAISTTCSSPSEDMSIRDVVNTNTNVYDECEVPLQQLARLREKLTRHSRAEDAAVKRIRDLEMQIASLKSELEESQNEREMLKRQISDHLVLISNLQIRLDEQRIRAEHIEKQTNTSLEVQNYDLKNTIVVLEETVLKKEKLVAQLQATIEETKKRLLDREKEISANSNKESEIVAHMQEQLEMLRSENLKLKSKVNSSNNEAQILPSLVENIITEKNSDIENLKEQLSESERKLEVFVSWNLNKKQIDHMNRLRVSGISFQDLLDLEEAEQVRRLEVNNDTLRNSQEIPFKRGVNETVFLGVEPEISSIEKIGPAANLFYSLQTPPVGKQNSTEKHVRFEDEVELSRVHRLEEELKRRDEERLKSLTELEDKVKVLQATLEETEETLKRTKEIFEEELKRNDQTQRSLKNDLETKRVELEEKEKQFDSLKKELKASHESRECVEEELKRVQANVKDSRKAVSELNEQLNRIRVEQREKEEKISDLKTKLEESSKELLHLQSLLSEKDKIIAQMSEDSKTLHINLETIQSKLTETGNVVDLGRRLREEQKKNSDLLLELHSVKAQLMAFDRKSIDDITGQVQRELDYSAYLDQSLISAVEENASLEDVEALKLAVKKQKSVNKQLVKAKEMIDRKFDVLERDFDDLKRVLEETKKDLERERVNRIEDVNIMEQLRIKLNGALDDKSDLERVLEAERRQKANLEGQLRDLKQTIDILKLNTTSANVSLENQEILMADRRALEKKVDLLEETNENLNEEIAKLRKVKKKTEEELKENLKNLQVKVEEVEKLQDKIENFKIHDEKMSNLVERLKLEVHEKSRDLEKFKHLASEMDSDRKLLKRQMDHLNQRLKSRDLNLPVPEELLEKIKELKTVAQNNMQMVDLITRLTNEKSVLEERILVLESQNLRNLPFDDPVSRANYLFAKYLRAESYRKALAWQKRYLISLLETYQNNLEVTIPETVILPSAIKRSSGIKRFKCIALVLVTLNRMKYLVRRWHAGQRLIKDRNRSDDNVEFHVGKPVSSQNFTNRNNSTLSNAQHESKNTAPAQSEPVIVTGGVLTNQKIPNGSLPVRNQVELAWFSNSPPSKDIHARVLSREALTSPGLLSKYMERFSEIQERLGLDGKQ